MPERVLVIGLDSASLPWVEKWAEEGRLPNLKRLMDRSAVGVLRSVNPPLSPAAWSSFATGMLPAKHGVYDHIYRLPDSYDIAPTNARLRNGAPVWDYISRQGRSVGVINVPETYPPAPVRGFMLSGMDTPSDQAEFSYPPELKQELQQAVGGYSVFGLRSKENLDRSIAGMHQTIPMRVRAGKYLWEKYCPDFMVLVFMETDVIQHKTWKYMDPSHPEYPKWSGRPEETAYKDAIPGVYTRADESLGPWLDSLSEDTTVIVMSDHGAGLLKKFLHLNNWLVREGFLRFKGSALARMKTTAFQMGFTPTRVVDITSRLRLGIVDRTTNRVKREMVEKKGTTLFQRVFLSWTDVDWSQTRAYALGGNFTGFYVNLRGREPQGCIAPGKEYEQVREELIAQVKGWRDPDTGELIVDHAYRREELHQGPLAERAPDVIFTTREEAYVGFGGHEFASNRLMETSPMFNGHHRLDGMVAISGPGIRPGRLSQSHITDIAPTVLYLLGLPVPEDMDGKVIQEAFQPGYWAAHPVLTAPASDSIPVEVGSVNNNTQPGDELVMKRLKDLGYL